MLESQIRKLNKYQMESAFMTENAADFPRTTLGDRIAQRLDEVIAEIQTLAGEQSSQVVRQNISVKDEKLVSLINLLKKINRAAHSLAEEIDGIEDLFRMPRRRSQARWLAVARAFEADAAQYETELQVNELTPTFRTEILALVAAVEQAGAEAGRAAVRKGGATGGLVAAFREAGKLSRRLNNLVRNKYDDNPQKLAAWAIAAHCEAEPRHLKEEEKVS